MEHGEAEHMLVPGQVLLETVLAALPHALTKPNPN
jgi:hypothetical protein